MIKIHYEYKNFSSKKTVVFLHGWGLDGDSFNSIIKRVKAISTVKIDLCGFGLSDKPKEYFDTYEYAYQIFLLLKKLKVKNIVLVGHSFGGRLAIVLSSKFNINVEYLILTSSAGINKFNLKVWFKIKFYKILKCLNKFNLISNKFVECCGSTDYKNASKLMQKILTKVVNQDLKFLLKFIVAKVLLVWDKKDRDTPYFICKTINKHVKQSKIILYNKGGHFVAFCNINKFTELLNKVVVNDCIL